MSVTACSEGIDEKVQEVLKDLGKSADQIWKNQIGNSEEAKQKRARGLGSARALAKGRLIDLDVDEDNAEELVNNILRDAAKPHLHPNGRKEGS